MTAALAYIPRTAAAGRDRRVRPPLTYGRRVIANRLRDAVVSLVTAHAPVVGGRLVDLGCADTPYRALLAPHLTRYTGIDLPGNPAADLHLDATGHCSAPDADADLLLSTQVLEHAADPLAYLAEARRLLRPGGRLILTTHGTWTFHPDPGDYWRWTPMGLTRLVDAAGFRTLELEGLLGLAATGLQLLQDAVVRKLPRVARPPACLVLQSLVAAADRLNSPADRRRDAAVFTLVAERI